MFFFHIFFKEFSLQDYAKTGKKVFTFSFYKAETCYWIEFAFLFCSLTYFCSFYWDFSLQKSKVFVKCINPYYQDGKTANNESLEHKTSLLAMSPAIVHSTTIFSFLIAFLQIYFLQLLFYLSNGIVPSATFFTLPPPSYPTTFLTANSAID